MPLPAATIPAANELRTAEGDAAGAPPLQRLLAEVLSATFAQARLADALPAFLAAVATQLGHDRVALGFLDGAHLRLHGLSNTALPAAATPLAQALVGAMEEALDQRTSLLVPEVRSQVHPRITVAHQRLRQLTPGALATTPIIAAGQPVGALLAWREEGRPLAGADLDRLEQVALQAAPALHLMLTNERPLRQRALARLREWRDALQSPHRGRLRLGVAAAVTVLIATTLVPVAHEVGGPARLEGAVQRVLAAPVDGYIGRVHARPGQAVQAGQVLLELSDQELELERRRWQSQMTQFENARAAAAARADRTQLAVQHARVAEAEAQLELAESRLARSRVQAPFDGVLVQGDFSQSLGAPVQQGAPLMTVAPRDQYRVVVEIEERDIAGLAVGQRGSLALSALPWDTLPLQVVRVTPMAKAVEGRNVFEVEARLAASHADLHPGLAGTARIATDRAPWLWNQLRAPLGSLRLALWKWLG